MRQRSESVILKSHFVGPFATSACVAFHIVGQNGSFKRLEWKILKFQLCCVPLGLLV